MENSRHILTSRLVALARRILPRRSRLLRWWRQRRAYGARLLKAFSQARPEAYFIQIGSNDGIKLDPLRPHILNDSWRGILIEPVPDLFEQLRRGYAGCEERLVFENLAIADENGILPFYHLETVEDYKAEGLPNWYDALGSFRREVIAAHVSVIPDIEDRIIQRDVESITFETLCERNGVKTLDLLHMDTEGYDFDLLKSIDFEKFRPCIVIYEHIHLAPDAKEASKIYMGQHGYESMNIGMDVWCLNLRDIGPRDRKLLELWRRFRRQ